MWHEPQTIAARAGLGILAGFVIVPDLSPSLASKCLLPGPWQDSHATPKSAHVVLNVSLDLS